MNNKLINKINSTLKVLINKLDFKLLAKKLDFKAIKKIDFKLLANKFNFKAIKKLDFKLLANKFNFKAIKKIDFKQLANKFNFKAIKKIDFKRLTNKIDFKLLANNKTINKINFALAAILVVLMSYVLAELVGHIFAPDFKPLTMTKTQKTAPNNLRTASNIFGSQKAFKKAPPKPQIKKISPLNLDLIGILFKNSDKSLAMIAPAGSRKSKVYRIGDSVKFDAVIKEIQAASVVFQRGSQTETLHFKKTKKGGVILNAKSQNIAKKQKAHKAKLSTNQRRKLNDYRAEIISNPSKLLSIVSVLPFFRDGKMVGVKVRPNKDKKIFQALGFKSGDIIVKINNIKVDSFAKLEKLRQIVHSQHTFNLEVKRRNKDVYLSIAL